MINAGTPPQVLKVSPATLITTKKSILDNCVCCNYGLYYCFITTISKFPFTIKRKFKTNELDD